MSLKYLTIDQLLELLSDAYSMYETGDAKKASEIQDAVEIEIKIRCSLLANVKQIIDDLHKADAVDEWVEAEAFTKIENLFK